jgi:hypothetical protein
MEQITIKIYGILFPILITIIAWFIKAQIMEINHESLMFKQEVNFKLDLLETKILHYHPAPAK